MLGAIDIGNSYVKYGLMYNNFEIVSCDKFKTADTIEEFCSALRMVLKIFDNYSVEIIGISCAGVISKDGIISWGGKLKYMNEFSLKEYIVHITKASVYFENDGKCAAMSENCIGSLKPYKNSVMIVIGTAIAGAIIINNQIYSGSNNAAAFSLLISNDRENKVLFQEATVSSWLKMHQRLHPKVNLDVNEYILIDKYFAMDESVCNVVNFGLHQLAISIINIQQVLDPEAICISGGIISNDVIFSNILEQVKQTGKKYRHINFPNIVRGKFNGMSCLIGAAINASMLEAKNRIKGGRT